MIIILSRLSVGLAYGGFDFAFFLFVPHPLKPFTRLNNRSTLNFALSLQNA
jgi:Sec-independent protein secretion pathway component TatC